MVSEYPGSCREATTDGFANGGSHTLDALRGRRIMYKPAVGINIPVVVVSGAGAPSSRQLALLWNGFIYKSAVGTNIMVLVVSGGGAPSSTQVTL